MGIDTIITALVLISTALGSFWGGRRTGAQQDVAIATDTVGLFQARLDLLEQESREKDTKILALEAKVEILEALVTQRAEVEEVKEEVKGVRTVVDRIALKVGA